jgi:hypothetical protein
MSGENSTKTAKRRGPGRPFVKGQSGNPHGRPVLPDELKQMCQAKAADAIRIAASILEDEEQPAVARLKASEIILDRGYGKASQHIEAEVTEKRILLD